MDLNLKLRIWRQKNRSDRGRFVSYELKGISIHMSFLEMLDVLNEQLIARGEEPVAFDHDCREGICGMCGVLINGRPHGEWSGTTTCQLHMRAFAGKTDITIEPFRAKAFPVVKDLIVDRSALDRVIEAGGYVSVGTGNPQDANAIPIPKENADRAMDAAACIGCGACVAACPNASAMLFVGGKISQLGFLPQGQSERDQRVVRMVEQMDKEGFGGCTNMTECSEACPKNLTIDFIARMNRDYLKARVLAGE